MKKTAQLALAWLIFIAVAACLSGLWSEKARAIDLALALQAPSTSHLFGTDLLGRDVFARMLCGGSVSLGVSACATALSIFFGALLGLASGYLGRNSDRTLMGFTDLALCFPAFFVMLSILAIFGPGVLNLVVILGLTGWMGMTRLVRAEVLSLKEREFILAARVMGAGNARVMFRHLLPNVSGVILANAVLSLSAFILAETGLSFLGLGVQPPAPSWGNILSDAKAALGIAWWLTFFPGLFIFLTVLSANVLGEELRDRLYS